MLDSDAERYDKFCSLLPLGMSYVLHLSKNIGRVMDCWRPFRPIRLPSVTGNTTSSGGVPWATTRIMHPKLIRRFELGSTRKKGCLQICSCHENWVWRKIWIESWKSTFNGSLNLSAKRLGKKKKSHRSKWVHFSHFDDCIAVWIASLHCILKHSWIQTHTKNSRSKEACRLCRLQDMLQGVWRKLSCPVVSIYSTQSFTPKRW